MCVHCTVDKQNVANNDVAAIFIVLVSYADEFLRCNKKNTRK